MSVYSYDLRAMGDARDLQQVVEKDYLLMTIDEQPEHLLTPINAVQNNTLAKLQSQIADLTQQVAAITTKPDKIYFLLWQTA